MIERIATPDVTAAPAGSLCREVLLYGTNPLKLKEFGPCGLAAKRQFMGCPLCSTHLLSALARATPRTRTRSSDA